MFLADADPDLFAHLGSGDVRQLTRVPSQIVPVGPWDARGLADSAYLGLVIVSGKVGGVVGVGGREHLEILGAGDVVQPYVGATDEAGMPAEPNWRVLQEAQVAVLDRRFATATARHPGVARALIERLVLRSRRLLFQLAVISEPRTALRIELMLRHFADRWGRVTPDGILLDLPVSHQALAQIVAAQRPSVTTALGRLREDGRIDQPARGAWLLPHEPPPTLNALYQQAGLAPVAR